MVLVFHAGSTGNWQISNEHVRSEYGNVFFYHFTFKFRSDRCNPKGQCYIGAISQVKKNVQIDVLERRQYRRLRQQKVQRRFREFTKLY